MLFQEHVMKECNSDKITGRIHSIESFGSVDGPGVRFIVFLKGCHMRCQFCHNPDTWEMSGGEIKTADELLSQALRYKTYWKKGGGITVSGGEPLLQIDFLIEFFKKAKAKGIHTTLDTSGGPFTRKEPFFSKFNELMKVTDLVMLDIKQIDKEKHKILTGWTNSNILDMANYLSEINKPVWIRHVLVDGYTNDEKYLEKTYNFIKTLSNVRRVEVLPYHSFGMYKWEALNIPYSLKDVQTPSDEDIQRANTILHAESFVDFKKK